MKNLSCGLMLFDTSSERFLCVHATGSRQYGRSWGLPKGMNDDEVGNGEVYLDTAIRELREETGIILSELEILKIKDCGRFEYTKDKDIQVFFLEKDEVPLSQLDCNSFFEGKDGEQIKEVDAYRYIGIDEADILYYSLESVVASIINKWKLNEL
jgi:8-oxo-dGTP pyrophosphatase MutT (NUDIX family)